METAVTDEKFAGRRIVRYSGLAAYLGVPESTLRTWVHEKRVPHVRVNLHVVFFDLDTIDAWLASHEVATSTKGA